MKATNYILASALLCAGLISCTGNKENAGAATPAETTDSAAKALADTAQTPAPAEKADSAKSAPAQAESAPAPEVDRIKEVFEKSVNRRSLSGISRLPELKSFYNKNDIVMTAHCCTEDSYKKFRKSEDGRYFNISESYDLATYVFCYDSETKNIYYWGCGPAEYMGKGDEGDYIEHYRVGGGNVPAEVLKMMENVWK